MAWNRFPCWIEHQAYGTLQVTWYIYEKMAPLKYSIKNSNWFSRYIAARTLGLFQLLQNIWYEFFIHITSLMWHAMLLQSHLVRSISSGRWAINFEAEFFIFSLIRNLEIKIATYIHTSQGIKCYNSKVICKMDHFLLSNWECNLLFIFFKNHLEVQKLTCLSRDLQTNNIINLLIPLLEICWSRIFLRMFDIRKCISVLPIIIIN